ncbi:MAG: hypothetical protein PUP92_29690 [Rhizonema sp. PD38]|nr:hypothetical protein [Rhizonema sp. PD38]
MLQRLIQWFKKFFQQLFGVKPSKAKAWVNVPKEPPPPLNDTDLEFLFTELLEGVHQARGQTWASHWLDNIEHRVPTERWIEWLHRFGARLLESPTPNNELASRLVQLGDLGVGEVGDTAYDLGMRLLTRNQSVPIWEYEGPDAETTDASTYTIVEPDKQQSAEQSLEEEDAQSISLEELFTLMQQDVNLRNQIAQQLGIQTDDPEILIQAIVNQFHTSEQQNSHLGEV